MEKDKNRYITQELYNSSIRIVKNIKTEKFNILLQDSYSQLAKIPNKEEIHIYDLGKNLKKTSKQTIIYINNHINKTGINPLRGREQGSIQFYDITEIYQQKKNGKLAVCYGENKYLQTKENQIALKFLCNHAINAHVVGFKKIYGYAVL